MMKIFKYFLFAFLFLNLYSEVHVQAKPIPPGSGEGDVPANILFLIDSSASMSRRINNRDAVFGITGVSYDTNGDILGGQRTNLGVVKFDSDGTRNREFGNNAARWTGQWNDTCEAGLSFDQGGGTGYSSTQRDTRTRTGSKVRVVANMSTNDGTITNEDIVFFTSTLRPLRGDIIGMSEDGTDCRFYLNPSNMKVQAMDVATIDGEVYLFAVGKWGRNSAFVSYNLTRGIMGPVANLGRGGGNANTPRYNFRHTWRIAVNSDASILYIGRYHLFGFALEKSGNVYQLTGGQNANCVRCYTATNAGNLDTQLVPVSGLDVSPEDDNVLYITSNYRHVVQKLSLDGTQRGYTVVVRAGTGSREFGMNTEDTGELNANKVRFNYPNSIHVTAECKKPDWVLEKKDLSEVKKKIEDEFTEELKKAFSIKDKQERSNLISEITDKAKKIFEENEKFTDLDVNSELKNLEKKIVRTDILKNKNRIDGRGLSDVRTISCEVGILPRAHGSALFTRGETQAIVATTLGTSDDEQRIESLEGPQRERFMLHYNFPPFSVGETGRIGTGRREIGHGKLAWRAINSSLPSKESFPYTFRIVSEITESNGSSSMATVCGTSLALMDAGVPIKEPVAGIAMGLIKEGDDFSVLSDILGDEDHLGDMDFKVSGTKNGITSLQMDIKITGITFEIMEQALKQAKDGRIHILGEMNKALNKSRDSVGKHTPKMEKITVDKKDIATVIGKGGATIREIVEKSGAKVDVNDDGVVTVAAPDDESRNKAMQLIKDLTAKAEMNKIYNGKVIKIMEFGAFVNFLGKQDGLVHISELASKRVAKVTDVVKEGDVVKVKVIGFDRGKVKLSIKQAAV